MFGQENPAETGVYSRKGLPRKIIKVGEPALGVGGIITHNICTR
jgi:hypothetical protein